MGKRKSKRGRKMKTKAAEDNDEPEFLGTLDPSHVESEHPAQDDHVSKHMEDTTHFEETQNVKETQPGSMSAAAGMSEVEPQGELELSEDANHLNQRKRKRQRGPTLMKNIAKDPNTRVRVEFTSTGEPCGPGSVKLSSYLGPLVREHVPVTAAGWLKISEEVKTVMWRSIQARFELDQPYQQKVIFKQMGCLWRSSKSRLVTKINNAENNQQRMNLRPSNVSPTEWKKFVRDKTSPSFQLVSESYKKRRAKQIPHTVSRKGMVRLTEELKKSVEDPTEVSRLKVWLKSRTRKDGTPVNTSAAEKFEKAASMVDIGVPSAETNPGEDTLSQLLGPDNPGRLRAMGRSMSKTKLACFQVKQQCMVDMEKNNDQLLRKVYELQDEIENLKKQKQETDVGENSAARSVNKRTQPKCLLIGWEGTDEHVAKGRIIPSSQEELVNGTLLGPADVKVLIESAIKPDAPLWRPTPTMFRVKEAVGELVAWSAKHYVLVDHLLQPEDIIPTVSSSNSLNKCKLLDLIDDDIVVAEGRWHTNEAEALVNGIPLGSGASKVFVDVILQPETFIWRPTKDITYLEDCYKAFVSWPAKRVVLDKTTEAIGHTSPVQESQSPAEASGSKAPHSSPTETGLKATAKGSTCPTEKSPALTVPKATVKGSRSARKQIKQTQGNNNPNTVVKEKQICRLMDIAKLRD